MNKVLSVVYSAGDEVTEVNDVKLGNLLDLFVPLRFKPLHTLKFAKCSLRPEDMALITPILPSNLETLDLSDLSMSTACIGHLTKKLTRSHIRHVSLAGNPIGDGAIWLLLDFINKDNGVKSLNLARCGITSSSVFALITTLMKKEFDFLDISGNIIGPHGAEYIKQFLETNPKIREFHADDCQLSEGDIELVLTVVKNCSNSELISLKGNSIVRWREIPRNIAIEMSPRVR